MLQDVPLLQPAAASPQPVLMNISVSPGVIFRYVREGRFRIEERTLTAFQWLYSPQQHRIVSRADLGSPSR